jgi:hypothetical protein
MCNVSSPPSTRASSAPLDTPLNLARLDFRYPVDNPTTFLPGAKPELMAKLLPLLKDRLGEKKPIGPGFN